jgi:hypothetical protein
VAPYDDDDMRRAEAKAREMLRQKEAVDQEQRERDEAQRKQAGDD